MSLEVSNHFSYIFSDGCNVTSQIQSPAENPDDIVGGIVERVNKDVDDSCYMTFVSKVNGVPVAKW